MTNIHLEEIIKLRVEERILAISIDEKDLEIGSDEQIELVEERLDEYFKNQSIAMSWEEAKEKLSEMKSQWRGV